MSYQPVGGGGGCQVVPTAAFLKGRQILLIRNLKRNHVLQTCFKFYTFSKMLDVFPPMNVSVLQTELSGMTEMNWFEAYLPKCHVITCFELPSHLPNQTTCTSSQGYDRSADSIHHNRSCTTYPTESLRSLFGPTSFTRGQTIHPSICTCQAKEKKKKKST